MSCMFRFLHRARAQRRARRAFTLVEIMVAMGLFAILAGGAFSSALYVRRLTEANVRESIAVAVASGFLEQIVAADFPTLARHVDNRAPEFPFVSRNGEALSEDKFLVAFNVTDWGDPIEVPLINRQDKDGNTIEGPTMRMWFISAVERSSDTPADAMDIRIRFRWESVNAAGSTIYVERTLFMVRTRVPN